MVEAWFEHLQSEIPRSDNLSIIGKHSMYRYDCTMQYTKAVALLIFLGTFLVTCPTLAQESPEGRKVCQNVAPSKDELLVCNSECACRTFGDKKSEAAKASEEKPKIQGCSILMEHIVQPIYPVIARMNRLEGPVFIEVEMDEDGIPSYTRVLEGHPMLTKAAQDSVKSWRFNTQCSRKQTVTVRFRLSQDVQLDPPGVIINPPDEVELVAPAPQVGNSMSSIVKGKGAHTTKKEKSDVR